jgi:hypothetical protein
MKQLLYPLGCQLTALFFLSASRGFACTTCDSALAQAVRAAVFGRDFSRNLASTVLPFVIFLLITAGIYYGLPMPKKRRRKGEAA